VHYAVTGLGTWDSKSEFADNDQKREIEAASLVIPKNQEWKDYAICALASAAFPVGLAPRLIGATLGKDPSPDEYEGRRWPIDSVANDRTVGPAWLDTVRAEQPFWFTTADGGIIDNDPFEYARFSLKDPGKLGQPIEHDLYKVDRAVITVSPFPELKPIAPEGRPVPDLVSSFSALMPSLIAQARFKPSEIILAARSTHGSRYLIGPSRVTPDRKEQRYGIASGLLGGFGGFVARSFRDHDFQLGRRNCQRFLRETFALPPENKIIESWPADVDKSDEEPRTYYCILLHHPAGWHRQGGSSSPRMAAHFADSFRRIADAHRGAFRRRGAKIAGAERGRAFVLFAFARRAGISLALWPHPRQGAKIRECLNSRRSCPARHD
jgi:hypothetical protein